MQSPRSVLTPDALVMLQNVANAGGFAAAARQMGLVPSALTYRVRQIEDALDVLLFVRRSRQARLTEAGAELLRQGERLLQEVDAVANRVRRVATGWEPQLTIAADSIVAKPILMELAEAFFALDPPTHLRIRHEALSGTLDALVSGRADLALGVSMDGSTATGVRIAPLGQLRFVYVVAPHHPLADAPEPLKDELMQRHRAVAVADSIHSGSTITLGLLGGQDVFTVSSMADKLDAQLPGLGAGFLPETLVAPYVKAGHLVVKEVERSARLAQVGSAWRIAATPGRALSWWLSQLESATTRAALLDGQQVRPPA